MKKKWHLKRRITAGVMAVLLTVGMIPLDIAGVSVGVKEVKAESTGTLVKELNVSSYDSTLEKADNKRDTSITAVYTYDSNNKTGKLTEATADADLSSYDFIFYTGKTKAGCNSSKQAIFSANYTNRINTQGTMAYQSACVETTIVAPARVEIVWSTATSGELSSSSVGRVSMKAVDNGQLSATCISEDSIVDENSKDTSSVTANKFYKSTFSITQSGTYAIGSTYNTGYIYGIRVYSVSATAKTISASLKSSSTVYDTITGSFDNGEFSSVKGTKSEIVLSSETELANLSLEAGDDNTYEGLYSLSISTDSDSKKIYVKSGDTTLVTYSYKIDGYLNAPPVEGGETRNFVTDGNVFGVDSVTIDNKTSQDGYILMTKNGNGSIALYEQKSHGIVFKSKLTFTVKVPAASHAEFTINGCQYSGADQTVKYYVDGSSTAAGEVTIEKVTGSDKSGVVSYDNLTSAEQTLKIDVETAGNDSQTYIHGVSYAVSEIPNTVSGKVGTDTTFAGDTLKFTPTSSGSMLSAVIADDGTYSVDLKRGVVYTVSLETTKNTDYVLSDTVDLSSVSVGADVTKDFTPEGKPDTTVNANAVSQVPTVFSLGAGGNLTAEPLGQTLTLTQTDGSTSLPGGNKDDKNLAEYNLSVYGFDTATTDYNTIEADIVFNAESSANNTHFVGIGLVKKTEGDARIGLTVVRGNTGVTLLYSKDPKAGAGNVGTSSNLQFTANTAEKIHYKATRTEKGINFEVTRADGTVKSYTLTFNNVVGMCDNDEEPDPLMFGLVLNNATATVTNMKYTAADGTVLYDQNAYYNPVGTAPTVKSVSAEAAADRKSITVTWTGDAARYDGKYVLQVKKPGSSEFVDVEGATSLTANTFSYPTSYTEGGTYVFRVCGTLGNSEEQNLKNRNTWVESNQAYIKPALAQPVITLDCVSSTDAVTFSWTAVDGAEQYKIYRRTSDDGEIEITDSTTPYATVEGTVTSYTDKNIEAEVPYYYSVRAISSNNNSEPSEEAWTLPTNGHSGDYDEDILLQVTKRSYNTVFQDTIAIEGVAGATGKISVYVNDTKQKDSTISEVYGSFSFTDIKLDKGRNEVKLVLEYDGGKIVKTLNYVYLTDFDYVVDGSIEADQDASSSSYGVATYKTVTSAVDAAKAASGDKVIFIREGDYNEQLVIDATNITLIGEDSEKTRIYWSSCAGKINGSSRYATTVKGTGFTAENLTFENTWEYDGSGSISNESAEAFYSEAGDSRLIGVRLISYQDTLQLKKTTDSSNGSYYLLRCYILGNVDFMWGTQCNILFDDCDIVFRYSANKNSGYYTCFGTPGAEKGQYQVVYNNCRFTSESQCGGSKYFIGRPYNANSGNVSDMLFLNCYMGSVINKDSGYSVSKSQNALSTIKDEYDISTYYECGTYGAGYAVNINRRQASATYASTLKAKTNESTSLAKISAISAKYSGGEKSVDNAGKYVENAFSADSLDKYSPYESDDTGLAKYNAEGYASSASVTGGGMLKENNANYYKVATGDEFLAALKAIYDKKGVASVIEITSDSISLGYNEVNASAYGSNIIAAHNPALISPVLKASGVSKVYIKNMSNLTIFSQNGATIKHGAFDISNSSNVIIRNLEFDELWEWDEGDDNNEAGAYDINDWDYMTIENGSTSIWVDHCTFYKSYDGVVDIKTTDTYATPMNITVSWCKFMPGSKNNTFFDEQMDYVYEHRSEMPYYQSLLDSGMTKEQIRLYAYGQKKTSLLGQNDTASANVNLNVTLANNYYYDSMDRMPRIRFGTAHVYNCVMDAQELYDARTSITNADAAKHIVSNGASSTCDAQVLLENCYINGIINALNSGNGSSPSGYINAINSLYYINNIRYKLTPKVNTTLANQELKITDADTFTSKLPYTYVLRDAATLSSTVVPYTGAGVLKMSVLQWEKSSYIAEAESSSDAKYDNTGLPESTITDVIGNESNSNKPETPGSSVVKPGTGTDDDDSYYDDDDDDYSSDDSSSGSSSSTKPVSDILTADEIPGASVVQIEGVDFAQMGSVSAGTSQIIAAVGSDGKVPEDADIAENAGEVATAVSAGIADSSASYITLFASEDASIPADTINALKKSGKTLSIGVVDGSGNVDAIVTLDPSKLTTATDDFSLKIRVNVNSASVTRAAENYGIPAEAYDVIDFSYSGTLPGVFKVAVNVSDKFADGTQLALYYNNTAEGRLENQYQVTTVTGGYAEFAIDHCSQYVLVNTGAVSSGTITTNTLTSPKTADAAHIVLWLMLMGFAVAAGVGVRAAKADAQKRKIK